VGLVELGFWNPAAFSEEEAMPSRYPVEVRKQVVELARSGTRVAQLAKTFGMSEAVIYGWLKQERIDLGEASGLSTEGRSSSRQQRDGFASSRPSSRSPGRSTRCSSSGTCPQSLFPVIASLTGQGFDVQRACLMLGVSVSGYYEWKVRPPSARTLRHAWLAGEIAQVHKDSGGTYGTLRVTAELRCGRGIHVGEEQVHLLMRRLGIYGLPKRRLPRGTRVGKASSLDLVRRRFSAESPDRLWMTDITEHPTREARSTAAQ
jgi:putative transposase